MAKSRKAMKKRTAATMWSLAGRPGRVWAALLAAMTVVGGGLWAAQPSAGPSLAGWSVPALAPVSSPRSIQSVFDTRREIAPRSWGSIVVYHSGSSYAASDSITAASDAAGPPTHFIIGNGRGMEDGELHVTASWLDQLAVGGRSGASNQIGICLVGDGRRGEFTDQQLRRLVQLVTALGARLDIAQDRVSLRADLGPLFPEASFREQVRSLR